MMTRMHEGLDYRLYKIYIWGGAALVVVQILVSTLVFDALELPGPQAFLVIAGPLLLWIAGIFVYWWWVFLFKGNAELEEWSQARGQGVPGIKALKSWSTLHQAMAIHGGNVEALIKHAKKGRRPVLLWYGGVNLLLLWVVCPIVLGSLGVIPGGKTVLGIWLAGVFVWVALMLVGTPFLLTLGSKRAEMTYLAPLGLALTSPPGLEADRTGLMAEGQKQTLDGAAIFEGERHGRLVHIETIGKRSLTVLQAEMPELTVRSNDGKLVPDREAPEAVAKALKRLRKAKRWRGIGVQAGPEGIGIQRQSRGTNMWLYDLWLAEYLSYAVNGG
jgi:hypothetical protein